MGENDRKKKQENKIKAKNVLFKHLDVVFAYISNIYN